MGTRRVQKGEALPATIQKQFSRKKPVEKIREKAKGREKRTGRESGEFSGNKRHRKRRKKSSLLGVGTRSRNREGGGWAIGTLEGTACVQLGKPYWGGERLTVERNCAMPKSEKGERESRDRDRKLT